MRILFVAWNFPPRTGGAELMARELCAGLAAEHDVAVLSGRAAGAAPPGHRRAPVPGFAGFASWLPLAVPAAIGRHGSEVVLAVNALVGTLVRAMPRPRVPQATLVFGSDLAYPNPIHQRALRWALPRTGAILPISGYAAELARERGARPEGLSLVPPGIDPEWAEAEAADRPAAPTGDRDVLLFVGRIVERKGLAPFIEHCLPRIAERRDIELWVVGGEPSGSLAHAPGELERVRNAIAGSPVADRVRLLGTLDDAGLHAAYRHADVLVLPAIEVAGDVEGFGIVFLEAALHQVPAVSTRVGGIPDAVADGETGLLAPAGDWPAFARRVVNLLDDASLRRQLGEQARRRAGEEFTWRASAQRCATALAALVDNAHRR